MKSLYTIVFITIINDIVNVQYIYNYIGYSTAQFQFIHNNNTDNSIHCFVHLCKICTITKYACSSYSYLCNFISLAAVTQHFIRCGEYYKQ